MTSHEFQDGAKLSVAERNAEFAKDRHRSPWALPEIG
jgi:hypothetical protein